MTSTTEGTSSSALQSKAFAVETVAELLADDRRRYLLRALRESGDEATLAELARKIAAWELEETVADVSTETVERVRVSLYHDHVPLLADAGVVEFDSNAKAVALTEDGATISVPSNREFGAGTETAESQST